MKMLGSQPLPYLDANPESSFRPQPQLALYRPHFLLPQINLLISTVLSILYACPSLMFLGMAKSMVSTCPWVYLNSPFWPLWSDPFHNTPSLVRTKVVEGLGTKDKAEKGRSRPLLRVPEAISEFRGETDMDRMIQPRTPFTYFLLNVKRKLLKKELQPSRSQVSVSQTWLSIRITGNTFQNPRCCTSPQRIWFTWSAMRPVNQHL